MATMSNEETSLFIELYQAENCLWNQTEHWPEPKQSDRPSNMRTPFILLQDVIYILSVVLVIQA